MHIKAVVEKLAIRGNQLNQYMYKTGWVEVLILISGHEKNI